MKLLVKECVLLLAAAGPKLATQRPPEVEMRVIAHSECAMPGGSTSRFDLLTRRYAKSSGKGVQAVTVELKRMAQGDPSSGTIVWRTGEDLASYERPRPSWSGALVCVPETHKLYVLLLWVRHPELWLVAYEVALDAPAAGTPPESADRFWEWVSELREATPVASFKRRSSEETEELEGFDAEREGNRVVLQLKHRWQKRHVYDLVFDLVTKTIEKRPVPQEKPQ